MSVTILVAIDLIVPWDVFGDANDFGIFNLALVSLPFKRGILI